MGHSALVVVWIAASSMGAAIPEAETELQHGVFEQLWNDDFVWKFDDLPTRGGVPKSRIPYSGHIYLDKDGGTVSAMRKYDRAMNQGQPATNWEYGDTSEARTSRSSGFGFFRSSRSRSDNQWFGHCNGWSSAAIRHAEPQRSVTLNGVTFTPADIKGMLAEVYMYNEHEILAGYEEQLNPGSLHAVLANWIGRGSHAIVMDSDPGKEIWNYPVYAFASSSAKRSPNEVEVRTNIFYAKDSADGEHNQSPRLHKSKQFHYMLQLNGRGEIIGGYYFNDSDRIDFVWVPLSAKLSGETGNESGNPHVDVEKVLEIWRKSVPREARRKWMVVDPAEKDRAIEVPNPDRMLPRNIRIVPPSAPVTPVTHPDATTESSDAASTDTGSASVEPSPAESQPRTEDQPIATIGEPPVVSDAQQENADEPAPTNAAAEEAPTAPIESTVPQPVVQQAPTKPATPPNLAPAKALTNDDILSILNGAPN